MQMLLLFLAQIVLSSGIIRFQEDQNLKAIQRCQVKMKSSLYIKLMIIEVREIRKAVEAPKEIVLHSTIYAVFVLEMTLF